MRQKENKIWGVAIVLIMVFCACFIFVNRSKLHEEKSTESINLALKNKCDSLIEELRNKKDTVEVIKEIYKVKKEYLLAQDPDTVYYYIGGNYTGEYNFDSAQIKEFALSKMKLLECNEINCQYLDQIRIYDSINAINKLIIINSELNNNKLDSAISATKTKLNRNRCIAIAAGCVAASAVIVNK